MPFRFTIATLCNAQDRHFYPDKDSFYSSLGFAVAKRPFPGREINPPDWSEPLTHNKIQYCDEEEHRIELVSVRPGRRSALL